MDEKLNLIQQSNIVTERQMPYWIALTDIPCKTRKVIFFSSDPSQHYGLGQN